MKPGTGDRNLAYYLLRRQNLYFSGIEIVLASGFLIYYHLNRNGLVFSNFLSLTIVSFYSTIYKDLRDKSTARKAKICLIVFCFLILMLAFVTNTQHKGITLGVAISICVYSTFEGFLY